VHAKITQAPFKPVLAAVYKRRPQSGGRGLSSATCKGIGQKNFQWGKQKNKAKNSTFKLPRLYKY